jgi:hypothetical protein
VTQFGDTGSGRVAAKEKKKMSEYYLADHKAAERERQHERERGATGNPGAQGVKVTLLGDFTFPAGEPQGCDPYNSTHGKAVREAWRTRGDRR